MTEDEKVKELEKEVMRLRMIMLGCAFELKSKDGDVKFAMDCLLRGIGVDPDELPDGQKSDD